MELLTMKGLSPSQRVLRWYKATTGSLRDVEQYKSATGAASLEAATLRCVLRNLDSLGHSHLACLPWTTRKKLWDETRRLRLDSVRTWQMFVLAFSQEQEAFHEPKKVVIDSSMPATALDFTFKKATAPNFEWIVHLALEDSVISTSDWCKVKSVTNLASLIVYNRSRESTGHHRESKYVAEMVDRVVKAWGLAAREEGAFSKLRMLHFHGCRFLTNACLHFLVSFPALKICHFIDCNISVESLVPDGFWSEIVPDDKTKDGVQEMWYLASMPFLLDLYFGQSVFSYPLASPLEYELNPTPGLFLYDRNTVELKAKNHVWLLRTAKQRETRPGEADVVRAGEHEHKKRKLRATKERNVGDLLGQMGG